MTKASRLDRTTLTIVGLVLAVVVFFALNVCSNIAFKDATLDLTEGGLYTVSPGTRQVLTHLKEPITLRFYFSKRLGEAAPSYGAYATRVRELLERYAAIAHGKIRLEFYAPEPYSDTEDRAEAFGLQGVSLSDGGDQVYFGLAGTNSTDDLQAIAFFQPDRERFLEYDLTKLVAALANPKKPVIGVISTLPIDGSYGNPMMGGRNTPPWVIMQEMRGEFTVRDLGDKPDTIGKDIDVLMIVHPKKLPPKTQFAIDQFVLGGGRALVMVDPNSEADSGAGGGMMMMMGATSSDMPRLFKAWGVDLVPDKVAGDRTLATRVSAQVGDRQQAIDYIAWLSLDRSDFNRNDVVTGDLSNMIMASPGILEPIKGAATKFTPLITTSADATEIPADQVRLMPDFLKLLAEYRPVGHPLTLAARVQGNVRTAFPDGPPAAKADEAKSKDKGTKSDSAKAEPAKAEPAKAETAKAEPAKAEKARPAPKYLKESVKPIDVIVVADTDFLQDRFWVRTADFFGRQLVTPTAGNGDFVMDALGSLAGSDALIGLRARGLVSRPFELIQRIRADADARYLAKEQELQNQLKDTEKKLASLQKEGQPGTGREILTPAQQQEIEKFRTEAMSIRQSLREVQHALRQNIERLEAVIKFVNIGLVPILIAMVAVIVLLVRTRRRRRRFHAV